jgi:hypothetical protein
MVFHGPLSCKVVSTLFYVFRVTFKTLYISALVPDVVQRIPNQHTVRQRLSIETWSYEQEPPYDLEHTQAHFLSFCIQTATENIFERCAGSIASRTPVASAALKKWTTTSKGPDAKKVRSYTCRAASLRISHVHGGLSSETTSRGDTLGWLACFYVLVQH